MRRLLALFALFACFVTPQPVKAEEEPPEIGKIVVIEGEPSLFRGVKEVAAHAGDPVHPDDSVRTVENQRAKLLLEDGSVIVVGPQSELRLASAEFAFARGKRTLELELVQGRIRVVAAPFLSEQAMVVVSTPVAVSRMREGDQVIEHQAGDESTRIFQLQGTSAIRNLFADETGGAIVLKERYGSEVPANGDPSTPVIMEDELYSSTLAEFTVTDKQLLNLDRPLGELLDADLAHISGATIRLNSRPNLPLYGARPSLLDIDRVRDRGRRETPQSGTISVHWVFPGGTSLRENSR